MARLLILTSAELTRDPRARRAVAAAVDAGMEVVGVCQATGGDPVTLPGVSVIRTGGGGLSARLRTAGVGGGRRDRPLVREARGLFRLARLVRLTAALVRAGRTVGTAQIVHANDFDTLTAGWLLARRGARLVYDAHEIYTEQEADPPLVYRAVAAAAESRLARRADAVVTVNEPIADELTRRLRLHRRALVVHNVPAIVDVAEPTPNAGTLRVIYQGALGHGRQLDDLLEAARLAGGDVRFSLRVTGVPLDELRTRAANTADVLEPVAPDRLVEALAPFDVGVVVTRPLSLNDRLAAPNKLFEYLMAGLAVAVPQLPGVAAIVECEDVGVTYDPGDPVDLARVLRELAADRPRLLALRTRARRSALDKHNAEAELPTLRAAWGVA